MELKHLQKNWDLFGQQDPLWAILTVPQKRNRKWNPAEFFQTGEDEIASVMQSLDTLGVSLKREAALDFGCGVGRLTQALCRYFDVCCGVDIAPSMIELARKYNRYGDRCQYYLNDVPDLSLFEDNKFDFIYSIIVLQHMHPNYSKQYIGEFLRILKPNGMIVFQLPSELKTILPDSAFRAQIITEESAATVKAGGRVTLNLRLKNLSDVVWPADINPRVNLGTHWLDPYGQPLILGHHRVKLPKDLNPQEEVKLSLTTTVPLEAGDYLLELDMVQEVIAWFKDKGSQATRLPVKVLPRAIPMKIFFRAKKLLSKLKRHLYQSKTPAMEMHAIHKEEIFKLVDSHKGKIVYVEDDHFAGQEWASFRYFITK